MYNEGNLCDSNQFWVFLHRQFSKDVEEKVMTLGQKAVQQAVEQAREETKAQESWETAIRMLGKKFDIKLLSEITRLSIKDIKGLASTKHN